MSIPFSTQPESFNRRTFFQKVGYGIGLPIASREFFTRSTSYDIGGHQLPTRQAEQDDDKEAKGTNVIGDADINGHVYPIYPVTHKIDPKRADVPDEIGFNLIKDNLPNLTRLLFAEWWQSGQELLKLPAPSIRSSTLDYHLFNEERRKCELRENHILNCFGDLGDEPEQFFDILGFPTVGYMIEDYDDPYNISRPLVMGTTKALGERKELSGVHESILMLSCYRGKMANVAHFYVTKDGGDFSFVANRRPCIHKRSAPLELKC